MPTRIRKDTPLLAELRAAQASIIAAIEYHKSGDTHHTLEVVRNRLSEVIADAEREAWGGCCRTLFNAKEGTV